MPSEAPAAQQPDRAERLLEHLNPPQREAVAHGKGPLLVLAGAGSGKTRVLTHRVAHLVATGQAKPSEILAITFTNKAAGEMRDRVEGLVGRMVRVMWVMTFHSACARILRAEAERLGYTKRFTIYDDADSVRLVRRCLDELSIDPKRFSPRAIKSQISRAKNQLEDAAAYRERVSTFFEQTAADVYDLYEKRIHEMNAMDFDDLLFRTVNLLELFEDVAERYRRTFRWILVDEYQDTNHAQYRLLQLLAGEERNLCVVGDDDQSIYSFRCADIQNILGFERDFPGAHVVKLEQNYRSTQTILSAANAVVSHNEGRKPKQLWTDRGEGEPVHVTELQDEHTEARYIVSEIERLTDDEGISRNEIAVFYRTNAQSRVLEDMLVRADVSYQVIGGTKFYERAEIKDALAYLTLLTNPSDSVSFGRVVNSPKRGIGQTTVGRVLAHANTMGEPVVEIAAVPELVPGLGPAAVKALDRFASIIERLRELSEHSSVGDLLESVLEETGYMEALEAERTIEAQGRMENLQELVGVAREFDANWDGEHGVPGAGRVSAAAVPLLGAGRAARRRQHGDVDDSAQRQGARVSGRVHHRLRGGRVSALALDRRGQPRRRAAPLLRRHHARGVAPVPDLHADALAVRLPLLQHAFAVSRRAAGGARHRRRRESRGPVGDRLTCAAGGARFPSMSATT